MAGTFTYTPPSPQLGRPADIVLAALFNGDPSEPWLPQDDSNGDPWTILPNLVPVSVQWHEGARPPSAQFRYVFDGTPGLPDHIEEVFPLEAQGNYVYGVDDRIAVFRFAPDGTRYILFDGFAITPQADITPAGENATITAIGVPYREFDSPIVGARMRNADFHDVTSHDLKTGLPCRFNPEGNPNCTAAGEWSTIPDPRPNAGGGQIQQAQAVEEGDPESEIGGLGHIDGFDDVETADEEDKGKNTEDTDDEEEDAEIPFPVFLGPNPPSNNVNGSELRIWTLHLACQYIMATGNPTMNWTQWEPNELETLKAFVPQEEGDNINLDDPASYDVKTIDIEDVDVTGMCWPDAIEMLCKPHGFSFRWVLSIESGSLVPTWKLHFFRIDDVAPLKSVFLQEAGVALDPLQTNAQEIHLSRDGHAIANFISVLAQPTLVEASFVLTPGFEIDVDDADADHIEKFNLGDPACTGANLDKYRLFILDECGEGHWDFASDSYLDADPGIVPDLKPVLSTESIRGDEQIPQGGLMVVRRRKPLSPIIAIDPDTGEPFRAKLHVSFDYGRTAPGEWDTDEEDHTFEIPSYWNAGVSTDGGEAVPGTWDEVMSHHWTLLDDRIGIRITSQFANAMQIGERQNWAAYPGGFAADPPTWPSRTNGVLPLVELLVNADDNKHFRVPVFMLTCVVEADWSMNANAYQYGSSPTNYVIQRSVDARHRFHKKVISQFSYLADKGDQGNTDFPAEDDTDDATSMAYATVRAHQQPVFAGSVTIPRLTVAYAVGDKIQGIDGRNIDFTTNPSAVNSQTASAVYPVVTSVEWTFETAQRTTIHLTDKRAEYQPQRRHKTKPHWSKP